MKKIMLILEDREHKAFAKLKRKVKSKSWEEFFLRILK